jgi:hypothetical protein
MVASSQRAGMVTVMKWTPSDPLTQNSYGHTGLRTYAGAERHLEAQRAGRKDSLLNRLAYLDVGGGVGYYVSYYNDRCHTKDEDDVGFQPPMGGRAGWHLTEYHLEIGQENVKRVNRAFLRFAKEPNKWGSLGSGPFRLAYERNCCGLVLYLLEHGRVPNSFQRRVNTLFRTSLLLGFYTALTGVVGYVNYTFRAALKEPEDAIQRIKDARAFSHRLNRNAVSVLNLNPTPVSKAQRARVEFADFLMGEAFNTFVDGIPQAYKVVEVGKSYIQTAAGVAVVGGLTVATLGYLGGAMLAKTVTPADVAALAKSVEERQAKERAAANSGGAHLIAALGRPLSQPVATQDDRRLRRWAVLGGSSLLSVSFLVFKFFQSRK